MCYLSYIFRMLSAFSIHNQCTRYELHKYAQVSQINKIVIYLQKEGYIHILVELLSVG